LAQKPNKDILVQLMLKHGLSRADVAVMAERSESVIRQWLSNAGRDMPDSLMQLIQYKIADKFED